MRTKGGRGSRLIAALVVAGIALPACSVLARVQRLGVSSEDDGIAVHYVPCPGEAVTAVRLWLGEPDEGGQVIWEIMPGPSAPLEARGVQTYRVGSPSGLQETVPITRTPAPDEGVAVQAVVASEGGGTSTLSLSFTQGSLQPGRIFTLGGTKDRAAFEEDALATCES
jgi:hypothetical protein